MIYHRNLFSQNGPNRNKLDDIVLHTSQIKPDISLLPKHEEPINKRRKIPSIESVELV
jgi:hypothetical protein